MRFRNRTQDTPHSVGIFRTTDRSVAENKQRLQETDINALRGIRTHKPSKQSPQTYALDRETTEFFARFT